MDESHNHAELFFLGCRHAMAGEDAAANECIRKAATTLPKARTSLGISYLFGNGVEESRLKAKEQFLKAARRGCAGALFCLGNMYLEGNGVDQNTSVALRYWRCAARMPVEMKRKTLKKCKTPDELISFLQDESILFSQQNLAILYGTGEYGVKKNRTKAEYWSSELIANHRGRVGKCKTESSDAPSPASKWSLGEKSTGKYQIQTPIDIMKYNSGVCNACQGRGERCSKCGGSGLP